MKEMLYFFAKLLLVNKYLIENLILTGTFRVNIIDIGQIKINKSKFFVLFLHTVVTGNGTIVLYHLFAIYKNEKKISLNIRFL